MSESQFINGNVVMNGESVGNSLSDFTSLHLQSIRRLTITVEVLDKNNNTMDVLQGLSTGGSLSVDGTSLIRRTGTLSFVLFDRLLPAQNNLLWITNKIRIYAGIDDLRTQNNTTTHFCLGTFYITEPSVSIAKDNRSITINLQDRMGRWEDEEFENTVIIEANTPIAEGLKAILTVMGETEFSEIQSSDLVVPYQLEFAQGSTVIDAIDKIAKLYMDWDAFYDTEGKFVFRKMQLVYDRTIEPQWVFDENSPLMLSFDENYTYKGVKNRIVVFGAMDEKTGLTPRSQADLIPSSTFGSDAVGIRKKVFVETTLTTKEQCQAKSQYELWKASNLQESASIVTMPIYYLDANHIIQVTNPATKEVEKYIVDTIALGLNISETMTITAHKVYYDDIQLDVQDAKVEYIIDKITNKGWLATPEARILQYYGLKGNGTPLVVNFEYNSIGGTTAYTTGYLGTTTQTLTVDLVDLGSATDDNGDHHTNKGDYADRIIGHEMVHAVMNSAMGMAKTSTLPTWFKEGSAEFIHGADERLKISIVEDEAINDSMLDYIIDRGVDLLNGGGWISDSNEYSASYVILKYIDKNMKSGKDMKSFMASILGSAGDGAQALKDAITLNTTFTTYQAFVDSFKANGANFVKTKITLNLTGDEVDTGSIGGIDHRGTVALNAEDIFDESKAVAGVISTGFVVTFNRP
ncbi:hypothetical protein V7094_15510 [Priestia megaterium]|uniref:DUF5048 domain-containing protein n=1 Tax=Priestia megaterium TaxID=1404 RepID=UPI002FFDAEC0